MIGSIIDGRYILLSILGTGGMGCVYEAEHTKTRRKVAVKVVDQGLRGNSQVAIERFYREARAAGAIDTQHIAQVLDVGTDSKTGNTFATGVDQPPTPVRVIANHERATTDKSPPSDRMPTATILSTRAIARGRYHWFRRSGFSSANVCLDQCCGTGRQCAFAEFEGSAFRRQWNADASQ